MAAGRARQGAARLLQACAELTLALAVAGSALAFAGEPGWARGALLLLAAAAAAQALPLALLEPRAAPAGAPATTRSWAAAGPPLLLPAAALAAWSALQALPLGPGGAAASLVPERSLQGALALAAFCLLHAAAWVVTRHEAARERAIDVLALLGLLVGTLGLLQGAAGTWRIYGVFERYGDSIPYGPFWNRNHYALYMAMLAPLAMRGVHRRAGPLGELRATRESIRDFLLHLGGPRGAWLMVGLFATAVMVTSLAASRSRGGLLALLLALLLVVRPSRRAALAPALALAVLAAAVVLLGGDELARRFLRDADSGRLAVWREAVSPLHGWRWLAGYGLDSFTLAAPDAVALWRRSGLRLDGLAAYAHNEYLQVLLECGLVGLALVLAGVARALAAARRDRWLLASLAAAAAHAGVDFAFHVPAVAALLAVLAALGGASERGELSGDRRPPARTAGPPRRPRS